AGCINRRFLIVSKTTGSAHMRGVLMTDSKSNQKKSNLPFVFASACLGSLLGLIIYVKDWV
ncbi:hypothetical protein, partial [Bacillus massiliigorillae]|uniref:hypothetical protein n=1 Tax=Bacillus massiliigorillae TaxID=1243664 RepID=UPI001E536DC9